MLRTQIYFLIIFNIISCAVNQHVLNPEYKNIKIKNRELLIVEIDSSVFSADLSLLKLADKNLQKEYLSAFQKGFENGIAEASSFLTISTNRLNEPEILEQQKLNLPTGESPNFFLPKTKKIIMDKDGHVPDYILIISKLELTSTWVEESFGPYKAGYRQTVDYVFWDNFRGKTVSYGRAVVSSQSFSLRFDSIITRYFIRQNARVIIANNPFKR